MPEGSLAVLAALIGMTVAPWPAGADRKDLDVDAFAESTSFGERRRRDRGGGGRRCSRGSGRRYGGTWVTDTGATLVGVASGVVF